MNQARGIESFIRDRFDLTLECIRLYYLNKENPLNATIQRYKDFFDLFVDFNGYIDFFLLQDMIEPNGKIRFFLGTGNFDKITLPETEDDYLKYINNASDFIKIRSNRISKSVQYENN